MNGNSEMLSSGGFPWGYETKQQKINQIADPRVINMMTDTSSAQLS